MKAFPIRVILPGENPIVVQPEGSDQYLNDMGALTDYPGAANMFHGENAWEWAKAWVAQYGYDLQPESLTVLIEVYGSNADRDARRNVIESKIVTTVAEWEAAVNAFNDPNHFLAFFEADGGKPCRRPKDYLET